MAKLRARINGKEVDLETFLLGCMQKAVDSAAEKTIDYLTNYIIENWYEEYEPRRYQRTYDFLKSVSKTETTVSGRGNNKVICMIYFDTNKIIPRYYGKGHLNAHTDNFGRSIAEDIPKMIENGSWFYGRGETEGLGSMKATIEMLERDFPKMVEKELKKMGLPIKFTVGRK